uniref:Uncharacterized protein n=1 Tax=Rhizophora mucronata TaxID=61149 RepID=A0A2P2IXA0_RHIMU
MVLRCKIIPTFQLALCSAISASVPLLRKSRTITQACLGGHQHLVLGMSSTPNLLQKT